MQVLRGAKRLIEEGRVAEAMAICRWVLEREPDNPIAWNTVGHGCWKGSRIRLALKYYDRAIALWPEYPEAWNNRGVALGELGCLGESLFCANWAVHLGPRGWIRLCNKASALEKLGRFEEALHCHQRLRFLDPSSESQRARYRQTLADYKALRRALREAEDGLNAHRQDPEAWDQKGFALQQLGRLEESLECYERALEIDGADEQAWYGKGCALHRLGSCRDAIESFDQTIEIGRSSDDGENFGAWHQKGLCLATTGEAAAAIDCHTRTLALWPKHLTAWFDKGVLEDQLGRLDDAKASFRRGLEHEWPLYIGQKEWAIERLAELEEESA